MRIRPESTAFIFALGLLASLPPLSIDMGLPALGAIAASLNASPSSAAMTLSLFLVGFAVAPIIYGPLSDRYGRRPILLIGCALFTISSIGCATAPSIGTLLAWRIAEGAGAGAGTTISVAIVRDLFEGHLARSRLSYIAMLRTVAPMIAPTLGVAVMAIGGWRSIYAMLTAGGILSLTVIALGIEESAPSQTGRSPHRHRLFASYARVLRHPISCGYALVNAFLFGCQFAYITGSPLVMMQLFGVSPQFYGALFASAALGITLASFLNGRLSARGVPAVTLLRVGLGLSMTANAGLIIVTLSGGAHWATLMPFLILSSFSYGMVGPNAIHGAVDPVPEIAGVASGLLGFLQFMIGAFAGTLVGILYDGRTPLAMTGTMALFAAAAVATYWGVVRRAERRAIAPYAI